MRNLILLFFAILLFSCEPKVIQKTGFLIGNWQRLGEKEGKQTYEYWNADLKGLGFTLQNKDRTFKEILSIQKINDTVRLVVEGVNENPTHFTFTKQTDSSFVCENLNNEFPTHIKYWKKDNQLKAEVWNKEFSIDFTFQKLKD